jgi:hypothetical protein
MKSKWVKCVIGLVMLLSIIASGIGFNAYTKIAGDDFIWPHSYNTAGDDFIWPHSYNVADDDYILPHSPKV